MDGKAFARKSVTDSASTAELGRPFQRGIRSGKKENFISIGSSKDMSELMRMFLFTFVSSLKTEEVCAFRTR